MLLLMLKLFRKRQIDIDAFIADSVRGLQLVTEEHRKNWRLGQEVRWEVDEDLAELTLEFEDGVIASAPAQIVGSYHLSKGYFVWGWKHPAVPASMQLHAAKVRAFGNKNNAPEFTTSQVPCSERRAWEFTALAVMLAEANGAYRVQGTHDTFVYMTFGEFIFSEPARLMA